MRTQFNRTASFSVASLAMVSAACSGVDARDEVAQSAAKLIVANAPTAAQVCDGTIISGGELALANIDRQLERYICVPRDGTAPQEVWLDKADGTSVNINDLRLLDRVAFKEDNQSIDPALRAQLDASAENARIAADVWFAVDESDLSLKDEILADQSLATTSDSVRQGRMKAVALAMIGAANSSALAMNEAPIEVLRAQEWLIRSILPRERAIFCCSWNHGASMHD